MQENMKILSADSTIDGCLFENTQSTDINTIEENVKIPDVEITVGYQEKIYGRVHEVIKMFPQSITVKNIDPQGSSIKIPSDYVVPFGGKLFSIMSKKLNGDLVLKYTSPDSAISTKRLNKMMSDLNKMKQMTKQLKNK